MKLELERGSFAGHETFPFRYAWLPKAVEFVGRDPGIFRAEDAMVQLGVGKNMVKSIRHWALATGVLEEDRSVTNNRGRELRPTELGRHLLGGGGWDPYLEDAGTLWLLHWQLASTPGAASTWYLVFNQAPSLEFSKQDLVAWLLKLTDQVGRVSEASLRRDVDCFIRTYASSRVTRKNVEEALDCPLVELALLRSLGSRGRYIITRGEHPSLPNEVFVFALVEYLTRELRSAKTIPLTSIALGVGSPGRVFCLNERALLARLDRVAAITKGAIVFDETAGLQQLLVRELPPPHEILRTYYKRRRAGAKERIHA